MGEEAYFDAQSAVPVDVEVAKAMVPFFTQRYGNPSSLHTFGRDAKSAVEEARATVATFVNANPRELYLTSGATESLNLAIDGILADKTGGRVITSVLEHPAVSGPLKKYAEKGIEVIEIPVDSKGIVDPYSVLDYLEGNVHLVAIQHANQEIGVIQDVETIGTICKDSKVPFLVDATASVGKIPVDVKKMNATMVAFSGADLYGPKGTGALYVKMGTPLVKTHRGGGQEKDLRPGTENVPAIVGFGVAAGLAMSRMEEDAEEMRRKRDTIIEGVLDSIPKSHLNGSREKRLPNNAHFRFDFIEGESLILNLDMIGIYAATGSACSSKNLEASKVLLSLGLEHEQAHGSLQLTLSRLTTDKNVKYLLDELPGVVKRLRQMSPLYVEE